MQNHHQPPPLSRKPPLPPPTTLPRPSNPLPPTRPDPKTHSSSSRSPHSPNRSDPPENRPPPPANSKNAGAIVAVENYYSPLTSPLPVTPPSDVLPPPSHQIVSFTPKEAAPPQSGGGERKRKVGLGLGGEDNGINKAALGIRVLELAFCLVSFSVMATDKTQGWSGDSFDRYKEYRFCLTVNIIGFVYAGFQAFDLAYLFATGKHAVNHHLRYHFDFILDQIIAYLLMSASSAATTRVVDWELNWGKDDFTKKASASVSMAFLAFFGFAMSSLISGYNLCNRDIS